MNAEEQNGRKAPFLVLVAPCYNEQEILAATMQTLSDLLVELKSKGLAAHNSLVCYVDDGSSDATWQILENRHKIDEFCKGIKFAGNAGQQNALWAGLAQARDLGADCAITIDVDLQDDISVISQMLADYANGAEIVYGVRNNRDTDTVFKRNTARLFYFLMGKLDLGIIPNHAEFRLMGRPVLEALRGFEERNLFIRGLMPELGFSTSKVYYKRLPRLAGETKYSLRAMISTAWQGVTACSVAPLRIAGVLSFLCMLASFILAIIFISKKYIFGAEVLGWTSLFIAILFMGSVQLFCLAVIGEYIAKIFTEVRRRPRYIIEKRF